MGMSDWGKWLAWIKLPQHQPVLRTFIIRSGLYVPIPAMPIPALAVPYAAPAPALVSSYTANYASGECRTSEDHLSWVRILEQQPNRGGRLLTAKAIPLYVLLAFKSSSSSSSTTGSVDTYHAEERREARRKLIRRHAAVGAALFGWAGGREGVVRIESGVAVGVDASKMDEMRQAVW